MAERRFTEEEIRILREIWPTAPNWSSVLMRMPRRTLAAISTCTCRKGILKDTTPGRPRTIADFPEKACWDDLKIDKDPNFARLLIKEAIQKCQEQKKGMHAIWAMPASLMDLHTWLTEQYPPNVDNGSDESIYIQMAASVVSKPT